MTPSVEHVGEELALAALPGHEKLQRHAWLVVNHRDFDRLKPLALKRLAYASSQATVPHERLTERGACV